MRGKHSVYACTRRESYSKSIGTSACRELCGPIDRQPIAVGGMGRGELDWEGGVVVVVVVVSGLAV